MRSFSREIWNVCFGSLAALFTNTTRTAAFEGEPDIDCAGGGHKKARYKTGLSIFLVAGA